MTDLELDDIQGLILRGYRKDVARHLVLQIDDPSEFKVVLGDLTEEDAESGPFITVAADWRAKPPVWRRRADPADSGERATHCVNIGFTFEGLRRLGLEPESLASFPAEFQEGAVQRAHSIYETGPSAPERWRESLRSGSAHAIVSLYADTPDELDDVTDEISGRAGMTVTKIDQFDAQRLNGTDVEHFGYVDGLSQPTIAGAPTAGIKDPFAPVPAGEFVLGQPTQRNRPWDPVPAPDTLGRNGSFAAFRVMAQDVEAFEEFLTTEAERAGIERELLAAKLCGRWRNGEPLVMRPHRAAPAATPIPRENLNAFDYEATREFPWSDQEGLLCPRGAHIRRTFPRSQRVIDDFRGLQRRIVRRGMPYGRAYDPDHPTDEERGIVGLFICASLKNQFEYIMRHWVNDGQFTGGRLGRSKDPMTGANDPSDSRFVAPGTPRVETQGFPRFVTTRGCAYLFLPSMTALQHIARLA
jgi:Dyp-type peroxidase family